MIQFQFDSTTAYDLYLNSAGDLSCSYKYDDSTDFTMIKKADDTTEIILELTYSNYDNNLYNKIQYLNDFLKYYAYADNYITIQCNQLEHMIKNGLQNDIISNKNNHFTIYITSDFDKSASYMQILGDNWKFVYL
jgi:hypothetical protein